MAQEEEAITDALSTFGIPPAAAKNLLQRAKHRAGPLLTPADWARFLKGPLLEEIQKIIPVFRPVGAYAALIQRFEDAARSAPVSTPPPVDTEARETVRFFDLEDLTQRQRLLSEVAREEGALGVMLVWPGGALARFPGGSKALPPLLYAAHRVLARRPYRVGYILLEEAILLVRPLGRYLLAVVARKNANRGRFMTRLLEVDEGGKG